MDIAIAGAGIAGLTTALALARRNRPAAIYDAAPKLEEIGAGIQLSPNAMHVLDRLGVGEATRAKASKPDTIEIIDGTTGRRLNSVPLGSQIEARHGAPYLVIHRAALQEVLLAAVRDLPEISLTLDAPVSNTQSASGTASFRATNREHHVDLLVAADGVNSAIRQQAFAGLRSADTGPIDTGAIAWRATIAADKAPSEVAVNATRLWLMPNTHFVSYPIDQGERYNLVAIATSPVADDELPVGHWPKPLRPLASTAQWIRWPLRANPPLPNRIAGRIAFAGDAAHAMLPTAAQGGGQAIEDAWTLAAAVSRQPDIDTALAGWSALRARRVARVHAMAWRNLRLYGLSGPAALARNLAIIALPARLHLARLDWLYGWKPQDPGPTKQ